LERRDSEAKRNIENSNNVPFYRVVLTGGPCGGKTTALSRVSNYLRERGFEVVMAPEVFTILASNGMSMSFFGTQGMDEVIQSTVLDVQLALETGIENILKARGKPAVLLCDRGAMDGMAYMGSDRFQRLVEERGKDFTELREGRYNAVFHMVTAADGAEEYYTLDNNEARSESPELARELDQNSQAAWAGHPRLYILDNSTDFEGKLQKLVESMAKLVGLPINLNRSTAKFLLKSPPDLETFTVDYHVFAVEKVYFSSQTITNPDSFYKDEYSFVRKRTHILKDGSIAGSVYGVTQVQETSDGHVVEKKRIINKREYFASLKQRDLSRHEIRQKRISFLYKHQSFNIHVYEKPMEGLCILHVQVEGEDKVDLPPFLDLERRLTKSKEDSKYSAYAVSLINKDE